MYDYNSIFMSKNGYKQDTYVLFTKTDSPFGYKQQEHEFLSYPVLGIGIAARSYIEKTQYTSYDTATCKESDIIEFIKEVEENPFVAKLGIELNDDMFIRRYVLLRMLLFERGLFFSEFSKKFGNSAIEFFKKELKILDENEMIIKYKDRVILSDKGKRFSNFLPVLLNKI